MKVLFRANELEIRPYSDVDFASTLEVYRQCEDFLALGPVAKASPQMVLADIALSKQSRGTFCGIWDEDDLQIGVIDFISEYRPKTASLMLLMISRDFRHKGHGTAIFHALECYLKKCHGTEVLESGVQTNNENGIRFWKKCGFSIGTEARSFGDGTLAYEMQKRL